MFCFTCNPGVSYHAIFLQDLCKHFFYFTCNLGLNQPNYCKQFVMKSTPVEANVSWKKINFVNTTFCGC